MTRRARSKRRRDRLTTFGMAHNRDRREPKYPPPHVEEQIASSGPRFDRLETPVEGTPITQLSQRMRHMSNITDDISNRVLRLEAGHSQILGELGTIKAAAAGHDAKLETLVENAQRETEERERTRKEREERREREAQRLATLAEADKERTSRRRLAVIAILGPIIVAIIGTVTTIIVAVSK